MKTFNEFLTESQKTYKFKIRVAGELPEGFVEHAKMSLEKFDLVNLTTGKMIPISEKPLDFPQLKNMEVHNFEAEVKYPTTTEVLQTYLVDSCTVGRSYLIVRGEFDPIEAQQDTKEDTPYETLLTKEELADISGQEQVGNDRIMSLLKELETVRNEREIDPMEGAPKGTSTDIGDSENLKSPVGS